MDVALLDRACGALLGGLAADPRDREQRSATATTMISLAEALLRQGDASDEQLRTALQTRAGFDLAAAIAPVAVRFVNDYVWLYACARRCAAVVGSDAVAGDAALVQAAAIGAALLDEDPMQAALAVAETRELRRRLARAGEHEPEPVIVASRAESFEQAIEAGALAGAVAGARFGVSAIDASRLDSIEHHERLSSLAGELERRARESPGRMFRLPRRA